MRLRMKAPSPGFHVILVNPEIPQNTGNIARLCAATGSTLHLVGEIGFSTDEKAVRRAGLDYWHLVKVMKHPDLDSCLEETGLSEPLLFTTGSGKKYTDAPFEKGCALVFGAESVGLPGEIHQQFAHRSYGIPTRSASVRSLNLANATAIVLYRALEVTGALDDPFLEE